MVLVFTENERMILSSEEKRKSVSPLTVRNTLQKIRNKAASAMEDLLFLGDEQPLQLAQVIGFYRNGRRMGKTKWKNGEVFREITSKTVLKRIKRGEVARILAIKLALNTGIIDEWKVQKRQENNTVKEKTKLVDFGKIRSIYPKILITMLENQFVCPNCKKAGLIFHDDEEWLWMHYNRENNHPEATFCIIGKSLPEKFREFPIKIAAQQNFFMVKLCTLEADETLRFYT